MLVQCAMRIDGRTLDHATLEQIRLMAIRRVREGEDPGVVIASYGFNRTTIYKWMHMAAGSGNGLEGVEFDARYRSAAQPHSGARATSLSLGQWSRSAAIRIWILDCGRARSWRC